MDGYAIRAADVAGASEAGPARLTVIGEVRAGIAPSTRRGTRDGHPDRDRCPDPAGRRRRRPGRAHDADRCLRRALRAAWPRRDRRPTGRDPRPRGDRRRGRHPSSWVGPDGGTDRPGVGLGHLGRRDRAGVGRRRLPRVGLPEATRRRAGDRRRDPSRPARRWARPGSRMPTDQASRPSWRQRAASRVRSGIARDRLDDVLAHLKASLAAEPDAIVVSGGVSVGPYDVVRTAFEQLGRIEMWKVAVQPGKPFVFGTASLGDGRPHDPALRPAGQSRLELRHVRTLRPARHPRDGRPARRPPADGPRRPG